MVQHAVRSDPARWHPSEVKMLAPAFLSHHINGGKLGKSWMLTLKEGVVVRVKLSDSWGRRGAKHDYDDGISLIGTRNCSWWPYDADHPERPMHFGGSPDTVLREAFVYYVDRAMGFETVPAARIVAIEPTFFARLFAPFVCTTQRQLLDDIQKASKRRHGPQAVKLTLMSWWQSDVVDNLQGGVGGRPGCIKPPRGRPSMCGNYNVTATRCGGLEPDVPEPVVPDCTDPASSLNFYRFHLVSHMVGRSDTTVNCFTTDFVPDREARCKSEARNHRPVAAPWQHINLDNDQSGRKSPRLKHPCSVPEQLRRHLSGLGNLTESVIEAMAADGSRDLLGNKDMAFLHGQLADADAKLSILKAQFKDCLAKL